MAVKTGPGAQRQTAVARSVSDLGALMSAKAEAQAQPQPDIQVQAEVSVLPESNHNLTGAASATKEADTQSTPATAQSEQTTKEETMSKNETTQAQAAATQAQAPAAQVPAADQAPVATAAVAEAPLSSSEVMGDATSPFMMLMEASRVNTAPTQTHGDLDKLLADATPDLTAVLTTPNSMVDYLQGRDSRFKTLVAVTKDTVSRVDALEAKFVELSKNGITKSSTLTVKSPGWKDQVVDGLLVGSATAIGVFGIAYAFDALFGQPGAAESGEPAIQ